MSLMAKGCVCWGGLWYNDQRYYRIVLDIEEYVKTNSTKWQLLKQT